MAPLAAQKARRAPQLAQRLDGAGAFGGADVLTVPAKAVEDRRHRLLGRDVIAADECLPFQTGCVDLVILQEVLEHVPYPDRVLCEIARVLRPGGHCYCQVPFQIGFHPGPSDFWRFSRQGLEQLFAGPEWQVERIEIALRTRMINHLAHEVDDLEIESASEIIIYTSPKTTISMIRTIMICFGWLSVTNSSAGSSVTS